MSTPLQTQATDSTAGPGRADTLRAECLAIARYLEALRRHGRTGPLAELRRLARATAGEPPPEAFWSLLAAAGITDVRRELFWEAVVPIMVTCPHTPGIRPGRALRGAGVSPARIERWLRLGAEDACTEARKLLRRIDGVDWVRLARLLWHWDQTERGDALRREFARDFFLGQPHVGAPLTTPAPTHA